MPGNSNVFRTGRMIVASAGMEGWLRSGTVPGLLAASDIGPLFRQRLFGEFQHQAAVGEFRLTKLEAGRWKSDPTFESPVRNLQPMNHAAARNHVRPADAGHDDSVGIDRHFHRAAVDAGKRYANQEFEIGFDDIDWRFPAEVADRRGRRLQELAMQSLGAINQLASPGPH